MSDSSISIPDTVDEDPVDKELPTGVEVIAKVNLTKHVIEDELHTDVIALDAATRAVLAQDPPVIIPVKSQTTGALHAIVIPDWMYGTCRETTAPLRTGLNFSFNALSRGTGNDEAAMPNGMRHTYLKSTKSVIKTRRAIATRRSRTNASVITKKRVQPVQ